MKIKSAKSFRFWFKTEHKKKKPNDTSYNENFIGTYYDEDGGGRINGFYELFHGDKPNIPNDLMDGLKNAQDSQAIYEFVQNAADCNSDYFAVFYDENYFLAINNGSPFNTNDLRSILNANQSTKTNNEGQAIDCSKIGRFGIGFKLVHRLVGENDGKNELVNDYKGPILFSWNQPEQFKNFIQLNNLNDIEYIDDINSNEPTFFKILITNFPTQPLEQIRDINYNQKCLFSEDEFLEFKTFLTKPEHHIDLTQLNQGSLFFLKLGKGKSNLLNENLSSLDNGVACSLNFLNKLNKVELGKENTIGKLPLNLISFDIKPNEIKSPEDEFCPAKITFGYFSDYKKGLEHLKGSPNFYKFFPLSKENHGLNFVIHSTAFRIKTDRTQFEEDSDSTNTSLFSLFWDKFKQQLDELRDNDIQKFKCLYSNLLVSKPLVDENNRKKWFYKSLYEPMINYLKSNIPTKNGYSDNPQNVKIKNTKQQLNFSDFGLNNIKWFEWDNEADNLLIDESKNKLGIESWDIRDIVENANLESINNWIEENFESETYKTFLKELEDSSLRIKTKERICQIKLFKFSNGEFCSFNEIISLKDIFGKTSFKFTNCFFNNNKTKGIKNELIKLGFVVSELLVEDYPYIFSSVILPDDKTHYDLIAKWCVENANKLIAEEKKNLFLNFLNEITKFDNVAEGTLKDLCLFCDGKSEIKPLNKLVDFNFNTPSWLNTYKIKKDEFFPELKPFLISETKTLFKDIYLPRQDIILSELTETNEIKSLIKLYQENQKQFFKEFIIKKTESGFLITKKTNTTYQVQSPDPETRKFIDKNCANNLFVLPNEFLSYKEEDGIIKTFDLYSLILDFVDVNEHKETLVKIIHYNDPKRKFLQKLTEFKFNSETTYTKDDYEFKILDWACSDNILNEKDYLEFRKKVVIEAKNQKLTLSEIPPFTDKIKIDDYEISLAKILPDNYENSDILSSLINQFIGLGLKKERIENLFGISEEAELCEIFQIFSEQKETLENAEQLAFVILYNEYEEEIELKSFKVLAKGGGEYDLTYNFYTKSYDFLVADASLDDKYKGIKKILKELPYVISEDNQLLEEPYFDDEKFICPDLIKKNLSDEQKLSLVNLLYNQWDKKNKKTAIRNIDWSKIDDVETENILGFNPIHSVFPSKYACESEVLPDYLIKWIGKDKNKISFLSDLGVWTENSVVVELRKFLKDKSKGFQNNRLAQETRFNDDETMLFNSFEWLKENDLTLKTVGQFETFKKVVEVVNCNRSEGMGLGIWDEYDFVFLKENSKKKWENVESYTIYVYDGEMPKKLYMYCNILYKKHLTNEDIDWTFSNYVFYRYNEDNYAVNKEDKIIYLNKNEDEKKTLQKIASDEENDFSFEDLWALFGESSNREQELEKEIAKLKKLQGDKKQDDPNPNNSFLDDVKEFISELEGTEWNVFIPELKNILELSVSHPQEKQRLFNLIAKIKLTKEKNVKFEDIDEYNVVRIADERYFVHSARGAFAYIHPSELLKMQSDEYKMAIDYGKNFKIYDTAEEILQLNTTHILAYQYEKSMEELFSFCQANRDANKHLLIIDKNYSGEKSRALLKLLNIEDDYQ
ncbi:MAG: hypothetical protein JSS90_03265 [Bacteroidetes bacterium]|jgi:hypothetical protein|nr:hypothetical protein [Bacteroidota bacterium]